MQRKVSVHHREARTDSSSCMLFLSRIDTCVITSLYSEVYYYIPRQTGLKKFDSFDFYILTFLLLIKSAIIQQLNNDFILCIILRRIKYNSGNVWIFVWITLSMVHDWISKKSSNGDLFRLYYADVTSAVAPVGSLDHACLQQRSCRLALIRLAYTYVLSHM